MPIYEYKCEDCGDTLEVQQKFTDDPLTYCEKCRKDSLRKVFSVPEIRFLGTGWYCTSKNI